LPACEFVRSKYLSNRADFGVLTCGYAADEFLKTVARKLKSRRRDLFGETQGSLEK
jgi:hypothetical protein